MELSKLTVEEFTALLGSDAPAPGGGSAAALCGALGSALSAMVSALTVGSLFSGALEIYGTASRLTAVYWLAGGACLLLSLLTDVLLPGIAEEKAVVNG